MAEFTVESSAVQSFRQTDRGNAEMLVALHGDEIKYCHQFGCWVVWDGSRWQKDKTGGSLIYSKAKSVLDVLWAGDPDARRWASKCESKGKISAMIDLATKDERISAVADDFDANPYLLNTMGGVIDLRDGSIIANPKPCLCTKIVPYSPATERVDAPMWNRFLDQISCGRDDWQDALIRYLGYSLTGDTRHEMFMLAVGNGRNGKSTIARMMTRLLGDYAGDFPPTMLLSSRMDRSTYELEAMKGVRFAPCDEPDRRRELDRDFLKRLVTGDKQQVRAIYGHPYDMKPEFKLFLMSNHKPKVEFDRAFRRRVMVLPFDLRLDEKDVNMHLAEELMEEAPMILLDLIAGCMSTQENGLLQTDDMIEALDSYEEDFDSVGAFLEEECSIDTGASIRTTELLQKYNEWAKRNNEPSMDSRKLMDQMRSKGYTFKRTTGGKRVFIGVEMAADEENDRRFARDRGLE